MPQPVDPTTRLVPGAPDSISRHPVVTAAVAEFARHLGTRGVHAALGYLNMRTRFRFTGVYRAEPPSLRNIELYDRENPALNVSGNVCPLDDTYCSIVCVTDRPFRAADAGHDRRLLRHPARASIISYFGVPVRGAGGQVLGTLCHFDVRPRIIPAAELPLLEQVAPLLAPLLLARGTAS